VDKTFSGVMNRATRELTARVPLAAQWARRRHAVRLDRYRSQLPTLPATDNALIEELDRNGLALASLDQLGVPDTETIKQRALDWVDVLAARTPPDGESGMSLTHAEIVDDLTIWRWGLSDRLLDLAERHIGLPVTYHGAFANRQLADGRTVGTRQWHRDIEDRRMLKILVWLNDVAPDGGPFTYVPGETSDRVVRELRYAGGYVDDATITRLAGADAVRQATGPRWTAVIVDTSRVFHRGAPPTGVERYAMTFTWTSRHPIKSMPNEPFTAEEGDRIRAGLTRRQLDCLRADLPRTT
jgi:hypothetical protein